MSGATNGVKNVKRKLMSGPTKSVKDVKERWIVSAKIFYAD
jgi:hypothetical protein